MSLLPSNKLGMLYVAVSVSYISLYVIKERFPLEKKYEQSPGSKMRLLWVMSNFWRKSIMFHKWCFGKEWNQDINYFSSFLWALYMTKKLLCLNMKDLILGKICNEGCIAWIWLRKCTCYVSAILRLKHKYQNCSDYVNVYECVNRYLIISKRIKFVFRLILRKHHQFQNKWNKTVVMSCHQRTTTNNNK